MVGVALLDELIANAWRPEIDENVGGWRFRWAHGVSRRANSALALAPPLNGDGDVAELVDRAERFYAAHDSASTILVSTASAPPALAALLVERGYRPTAHTLVQRASTAGVIDGTRSTFRVELTERASDAWLHRYWSVESAHGRTDAEARVFCEFLLAPELPTVFATAFDGDEVVGVGQSVSERGWSGVQCMVTAPADRGRGAATAVLHALAQDAHRRGDAQMYLAVMADNQAARSLYEAATFTPTHDYCYFVR